MVDARSDLDTYRDIARSLGLKILYVVDTHVHADHISGGRALAAALGSEYCLHESAPAAFEFRRLKDGEVLELGNVGIHVLHAPGHTPESICLVVVDRTRGVEPWFVLTGDALLVGDAGRPDLSPERNVEAIYASLHQRLAALADDVEVFPGHFSGSVCGRSLSGKPSSTLGFERRHNAAFQPQSLDEFRRFIMGSLPPKPPDFASIVEANLGRTS